MIVALRPEPSSAGFGPRSLFQSLSTEQATGVVRWALANRARIREETRLAFNNVITGPVSVRGFRDSSVSDAPPIMLIQPVRQAALIIDAVAAAVFDVWRESRAELYSVVDAALRERGIGPNTQGASPDSPPVDADDEASRPIRELAAMIGEAHPQYSTDDISLMIALTLLDPAQETEEEEEADAETPPEEAPGPFTQLLSALEALPPDAPDWSAPLTQLLDEVSALHGRKTAERAQAAGVGSRLTEMLESHRGLLTFFEWDAAGSLSNRTGPWADAAAVHAAVTALADLLARYETVRETGATFSEETQRAQERVELQGQIIPALAELEAVTAAMPDEPAIQEVIRPAPSVMDAQDHRDGEDGADAPEMESLRERVEALQQENAALKAAAESTQQENDALKTATETTQQENDALKAAAGSAQQENDALKTAAESTQQENDALKTAAESAQQENDALKSAAETAQRDYHDLKRENRELRYEAEATRLSYIDARKAGEPTAEEPSPTFDDVASVLDSARDRWPNALRLALNNSSDSKLYFDQPNQIYSALEWLATTYHDARAGLAPVDNLDVSLFTTCGWRYRQFQSEVTVGKYRSDYQTTDDGRRYTLEEHIGRGTGRSPGQIRVAFAWDAERQLVIVGYIGRHQRTDAS